MPTESAPSTAREGPAKAQEKPAGRHQLKTFFSRFGPGLITGAADDDPSGVATYSAAGAQFGFALLWTAPAVLPMMAAVQLMCARIGLVSGQGLAGVLRSYYPRWLLWTSCLLLLVANVVNIGADLGAMATVTSSLTGAPSGLLVPVFAVLILALLVFASYRVMARVFKWLTLVLLAYIASGVLAHPHWGEVARATVLPKIQHSRDYLLMLVAILGTTISPYLFFWQAAEEVEEEKAKGRRTIKSRQGASPRAIRAVRLDVLTGMSISVIIFYFIVLTTGATLHPAGILHIDTAEQAAQALRPVAGSAASLLFSLGIIGTGMLGVPVLAGSAALAIAEAEHWRAGMSEKPSKAGRFYAVMGLALLAGMGMEATGISAIRMLFWSAVVNGMLAPPLIFVILVVCNNEKVMGEWKNTRVLNVLGWLAGIAMTAAAVALIVLSLSSS